MRITIDNPSAMPMLLDYLQSWTDVVAEPISEDEIEVTLLGSYRADAMELELSMRVQAWTDAQRSRGFVVAVT
jgi:hypothetical protein